MNRGQPTTHSTGSDPVAAFHAPPAPARPHAGLFAALAAEFDPREVKTRAQAGRQFKYVTARTVMNRLDNVLSPENWWARFRMVSADSVLCYLTIQLPNGTRVTKSDVGGCAGMADPGDDDKSAASDGLKRAAVHFGVGRYLYGDGVPSYDEHHAKHLANDTGHGRTGAYAAPGVIEDYRAWLVGYVSEINAKWLDRWTDDATGEIPAGVNELVSTWQLSGHVVKWARAADLIDAPEQPRSRQYDPLAAVAWMRDPEAVRKETRRYCREKWSDAVARIEGETTEGEPDTEGGRADG